MSVPNWVNIDIGNELHQFVWDSTTLTWTRNTGAGGALTARIAASPAAVSVSTSSGQIVAGNSSRAGLVFVNTSANTISLAFSTTAVLNSGITLDPGAAWEMTALTYTTSAINGIASAAASNLAVQEFVL